MKEILFQLNVLLPNRARCPLDVKLKLFCPWLVLNDFAEHPLQIVTAQHDGMMVDSFGGDEGDRTRNYDRLEAGGNVCIGRYT